MLLMVAVDLFPQQPSITDYLTQIERKYGSDADLVNGEKYSYPYSQALGDPFLFPETRKAAITIHEKEFKGQQLRYDIYNQQLILDYENLYGVNASLVLKSEWVESFAFENQKFEKMEGPDGETSFFQVLGEGQIDCIYLWSKKYLLNLNSGERSYYFADADKSSFVRIEGKVHPYKSNGNFIKVFDPEGFGIDYDKTLLEALETGGGGEKALGRHAVAALLNAQQLNYRWDTEEIISMVQWAHGWQIFEDKKDQLEEYNEQFCPLD